MTSDSKTPRFGVGDIALLVVSIAFLVGIVALFGPCGPKEDGSWMTCHWAGNAVTGLATVLVAISIIHALVPGAQVKMGLAIATIPVSALAAVLPANIIDLCMMNTMHCRVVMRPAVIACAVVMIAAAVFDILWYHGKSNGTVS